MGTSFVASYTSFGKMPNEPLTTPYCAFVSVVTVASLPATFETVVVVS